MKIIDNLRATNQTRDLRRQIVFLRRRYERKAILFGHTHGRDKSIASSRNIYDVAIPRLSVAKCPSQRGDVHGEVGFDNEGAGPNPLKEFLFVDEFARSLKKS
jgi:hypothetical protein